MSANIEDIKALRAETGAPYKDCVEALKETGDHESAKKFLLAKGLASVRTAEAKEGFIAVGKNGTTTVIFQARCETDFVGRSEEFRLMCQHTAAEIASSPSDYTDAPLAEDAFLSHAKIKFKENIQVKTYLILESPVATYVYQDGKRAATVIYEGDDEEAARKVAVQVVSSMPKYTTRDDVDQDYLADLLATARQEALDEGKPERIVDKIAEGKVSAKLKDVVLVEQAMYFDPKTTVKAYTEKHGIKVKAFSLFMVGLN